MSAHPAAAHWCLQPGVAYLNHGSFGPSPRVVLDAQREWTLRLEANPMDFYVRKMEDHLAAALDVLGRFVGTSGRNLVFVDNATFAMNIVARSLPLTAGDEVLATDHEYGAVQRIWRQACEDSGASFIVRRLPRPLTDAGQLVDTLFESATPRTKLLVVSHVTSPTAVVLPVREICQRAAKLRIPVCIDGPHAPAAVDVRLDELGCEFYTASCHKWLSAPFGSGFLYVHPRRQQKMKATVTSWGQSLEGKPSRWWHEFVWSGTRDPAAFLAVPEAIRFMEGVGLENFRQHSRGLIELARQKLSNLTGPLPQIASVDPSWTATMITLPLPEHVVETPPNHVHPLQTALWEKHQIEVPLVNWGGRRWIRVSAHLHNTADQIERLCRGLAEELKLP